MINKKRISNFEESLYEEIHYSAIIFFRDAIQRLLLKDNGDDERISKEVVLLSVSSLQTSLELGLKAMLLKEKGLHSILDKRYHLCSVESLANDFAQNKLKTLGFEQIKKIVKVSGLVSAVEENFHFIDDFQKYRNGIFHSAYLFDDGDFYDLKEDILYFTIHILLHVLFDQALRPAEQLETSLGADFSKWIQYRPYVHAMERLAAENSELVLQCFLCQNRTYGREDGYCYCCGAAGEDYGEFVDCDKCKKEGTVIFDHLNIAFNNNLGSGWCLNCNARTEVYRCPQCTVAFNLACDIPHCNWESK